MLDTDAPSRSASCGTLRASRCRIDRTSSPVIPLSLLQCWTNVKHGWASLLRLGVEVEVDPEEEPELVRRHVEPLGRRAGRGRRSVARFGLGLRAVGEQVELAGERVGGRA